MGKLEGKTALVTGGSAGIGFAIAERLIAEGATVALLARRPDALEDAVGKLGARALAFPCDVTKTPELQGAFSDVERKLGGLDAVVINAGTTGGGPLATCTEEAYDNVMALNTRSVFFTAQRALPLLRSGSSIVVIGSVASEIVVPNGSVYAASKAALTQFVRCWAEELAPRGIRVNNLSPGYTETPLFGRITATPEGAARFDQMVSQRTTLKRRGRPEEVAAVAAFLCSDDASYMSGGTVFVGGGAENW